MVVHFSGYSIFWWKGDFYTSSAQTASEVGARDLNASTACLRVDVLKPDELRDAMHAAGE